MPKLGKMAQLSRPFQIALVAAGLLAAVWVFALHGRSSGTGSSSPQSASQTTTAGSAPSSAPAHEQRTLGSAPGLKGLSHAIVKAHGAAETSQRYNQRLEHSSAAASGEATSAAKSAATSTAARGSTSSSRVHTSASARAHAPASSSRAPSSAASTAAGSAAASRPAQSRAAAGRIPARQAQVEHALHDGKVAVILFWNPRGADDVAVSHELRLLEAIHRLVRPLAHVPKARRELERSGQEPLKSFQAFWATAGQVSAFGSITRGVHVTATPTILVVNAHGQASALTGLQDAFSIEQAIDEARHF